MDTVADFVREQLRRLLSAVYAAEPLLSDGKPASSNKTVVVLGAGYGGTGVARVLDTMSGVQVVVVTPNEGFFLHKVAALRASTKGGNWIDRSLIPLDKLATCAGKVIQGAAKSINPETNTVVLEDGQELRYDALVLATGSRNVSPGDVPVTLTKREDVVKYFVDAKEMIMKAKSIVIAGAGVVGVELAGELRENVDPSTKIAIVGMTKKIMMDGGEYSPSGLKTIEDDLRALNVDIILEDAVVSPSIPQGQMKTFVPFVQTPEGVKLRSGKTIDADLLIYAIGSTLNTSFLPAEWLDKDTKEVVVDTNTLQLKACPNVFAIGDIAKVPPPKRAYYAMVDAPIVAKNVKAVLDGKQPTASITRGGFSIAFVSLGTHGGRGISPYFTLGPFFAGLAKSKDLFVKKFWSDVAPGVAIPPAN